MAWSLPAWREPEAILELARVAVAERAGARREEVASGSPDCAASSGPPTSTYRGWISPRRFCASACAAGQPITYLVPDPCQRLHRRAEALHVTSEQLVEALADLAADKKALDIVELDLRGASTTPTTS